MKHSSPAVACAAALSVVALVGGTALVNLVGTASASTEAVSAPLAAPTSLSPDDSAKALPHDVLKTVRLRWAAVPGATGYRVQVGQDSTWSDTPSFTKDVVGVQLTLPVSLPHATYVWRVAALKGTAQGHWSSEEGLPQDEAQFTRGWRDVPTPTTITSPFVGRPEFSWSPVAYATGYQVQVSSTPFPVSGLSTAAPDTTPSPTTRTQATDVNDTCITPRTRITTFTGVAGAEGSLGACNFAPPPAGTTLFWRVRAFDEYAGAEVDGGTKPVSQAGISYLPPNSEEKTTADCTEPETASASASPSASPSASASAGASASPSSGSSEETQLVCADPPVASERSDWSAQSSFVWSSSATAAPIGLVPTDALTADPDGLCTVSATDASKSLCSDFPTISWKAAPGASRYRLYVGLDDEFSNIQAIAETSGRQWTPAASWRDSTPSLSYYYVVQACDASRCGPVTPTPPSFRKVTPRPTLGTVPPVRGDFQLTWKSYADSLAQATSKAAPEDALYYHLQVATADHPSFDALVDEQKVDQTYYSPSDKAYGEGRFVWRVQAVDSSGDLLPWSASQSFLRDTVPPRIVSVTPSAKVSTSKALKVVFSEQVTGLTSGAVTAVVGSTTTPTTLVVGTDGSSATLTPTKPFVPGSTYRLHVSSAVKDAAGNPATALGPVFTVTSSPDDSDKAMTYSAGWSTLRSSNASSGAYHQTGTAGRTVSITFTGATLSVYGCRSPKSGLADITVVGKVTKRVSAYRSYSGCGSKLAVFTGLGGGTHTVRVTVLGKHQSGASGNAVGLDGLVVS